jgi:type VI protein secretion system component Hcp
MAESPHIALQESIMNGQCRFVAALVVVSSLGSAANVFAQRAFLDIPGIDGESVVEGYVDQVDVLSIRQNAAATAKKSIACDIAVVKRIDIAGPALWATAASGQTVPEMTLTVLRDVADVTVKLYEIRLSNVRITGVQATTGAADSSETVTLAPQGVTLSYFTQAPTGGPGPTVSETFSCQ